MILIETAIVTTVQFDKVAERARVKQAFKAKKYEKIRAMLLTLLDSFVAGDLANCYEQFLLMERSDREYVNTPATKRCAL